MQRRLIQVEVSGASILVSCSCRLRPLNKPHDLWYSRLSKTKVLKALLVREYLQFKAMLKNAEGSFYAQIIIIPDILQDLTRLSGRELLLPYIASTVQMACSRVRRRRTAAGNYLCSMLGRDEHSTGPGVWN